MTGNLVQMIIAFAAGCLLIFALFVSRSTGDDHPHSVVEPDTEAPDQPAARLNDASDSGNAASPPLLSLAEIDTLDSDFEQSRQLYRLIAPMGASAIVKLIQQADTTLQGNDHHKATAIMIARLTELDHELAISTFNGADRQTQTAWTRAVFHTLARKDPEIAIDATAALGPHLKSIAVQAILAAVDRLPVSEQVRIATALDASTSNLTGLGWHERLAQANATPDMRTRMGNVAQVITEWVATDPEAALAAAESMSQPVRNIAQTRGLAQWSGIDPESALAWLENQPPSPDRVQLITSLIEPVAQADFQRARQLIATLPEQIRNRSLTSIAHIWAQQDPDGFQLWVNESLDATHPSSRLLPGLITNLSMRAPDILDTLLPQLPQEQVELAERILASQRIQADPEQYAAEIRLLDSAEEREVAAQNLIGHWSSQDVIAAAEWLKGQDFNPRLYQQVTSRWAVWDPDSARSYAEDLPPGEKRDHALVGVLTLNRNVDAMTELFQTTEVDTVRRQLGQLLYFQFRQSDPDRAADYESYARQAPVGANTAPALGSRELIFNAQRNVAPARRKE